MRLKIYYLEFLGWLLYMIKLFPTFSNPPPQREKAGKKYCGQVILQKLANQKEKYQK